MEAREIIAREFVRVDIFTPAAAGRYADHILAALTAAGWTLVPPGGLHRETLEAAAKAIENGEWIAPCGTRLKRPYEIAADIRALGEKAP